MADRAKKIRKGSRLGFVQCPVCHDEIVGQIVEAIYPGLVVVRTWCTKQEIMVFGCNAEPGYQPVGVTAAL